MLDPAMLAAIPMHAPPGDLSPTNDLTRPTGRPSGDLDRGHAVSDAHVARAPVDLSPASGVPISTDHALGDLSGDHRTPDAQMGHVASDLDGGHRSREAQSVPASVDLDADHPPRVAPLATVGAGIDQMEAAAQPGCVDAKSSPGRASIEAHFGNAGASADPSDEPSGDGQCGHDNHRPTAAPEDTLLLILADALDDLERQRIASENRLRSLLQVKGLAGSKAEAKLDELTEALKGLEHRTELELSRAMRAHPFGPWVRSTKGLGEKQAARLIAAIGDPYMRPTMYDRETGEVLEEARPRRGPAELWALCGYVPGQKRRKGVKSNWSSQAKMRAFLCAKSAMKSGVRKLDGCDDSDGYDLEHREATSEYGQRYLAERAKWAGRDTTDGHRHNHALRIVAKKILLDLFLEAKRLRTARSAPMPTPAAPSTLRATGGAAEPKTGPSPEETLVGV